MTRHDTIWHVFVEIKGRSNRSPEKLQTCHHVHPLQRHHLRHIANCWLVNLSAARDSNAVEIPQSVDVPGVGLVRRPHQECHFFATWPKNGENIWKYGKIHGKSPGQSVSQLSGILSKLLCSTEVSKLPGRNSSCSTVPTLQLNFAKTLRPTDASCLRRFSR